MTPPFNFAQQKPSWLQGPQQNYSDFSMLNPSPAPFTGGSGMDMLDHTKFVPDGGGGSDFFSRDFLFGNDKQTGALSTLGGLGTSLMNGFLGWQQYNLEKDKFKFEKDAWEKNWGAQTTDYNRQVADVANARASATGDFAGRDEYIKKNHLA